MPLSGARLALHIEKDRVRNPHLGGQIQHGVPNMRLILAPLSLLCDNAQFDQHLQVESAEECLIRLSALGAIGLLAPFCDRN